MYELCIYNARIMDPASGTDRIGAVAVRDKKIAHIKTEKQEASIFYFCSTEYCLML